MVCKYFLSFHRSPFHSVDCVRGCAEGFSCSPICLILLFLPVLLVSYPLNTFPRPTPKSFPPIFFFFFFLEALVSGLTFRSIIHFELTFVRVIRIQFYSFAWGYPVFPTQFVKETILSPCVFLASSSGISWSWIFFWALCSVPLV